MNALGAQGRGLYRIAELSGQRPEEADISRELMLSDTDGTIRTVGNLYDYFSAPDDDTALTTFEGGPAAVGLPLLDAKGMDPYLLIGAAEALLTGTTFDEVAAQPRFNHLLGDPEAGSRWVVTLTDQLRDVLAEASTERLAAVAVPWSRTEEFNGSADPEILTDFLGRLADIARQARTQGHGLYCWVSL
ncbi:hypothetical protein ABT009_14115 [Streptomyces sp. NPDC002896]|uniref:hypothetical protein n=1 Tax=Streptomyces sp. NPDC002896 TaxID=3154438 RepID=UPI00331E2C41